MNLDLNRNEKRELLGTYHTNKKIKMQVDNLMHQMAIIECNLGIDSTLKEIGLAKKKQLELLKKIKSLDQIKFEILKKNI
jgi:alanine racemase